MTYSDENFSSISTIKNNFSYQWSYLLIWPSFREGEDEDESMILNDNIDRTNFA